MCSDTRGHLYVLISAGLPFCQKCKYDPKSPIKFIADVEGISFSEVYQMCDGNLSYLDVSVEEAVDSLFEEEEEEFFEYEVMAFDQTFVPVLERVGIPPIDNALDRSQQYLLDRGVTREEIQKYDIRYCYEGQYAGRVVVPCLYEGDLVTFVARDLFGFSDRKYLNPQGNKQSDFLYNAGNVKGETVVLTEGVFDAISASRCYPAVASFGKSLSSRQIDLLNCFKLVVFYWDVDAYPQAEKYAQRIQAECVCVLHADGKDAGSRSQQENQRLLDAAVPFGSVPYEMFKLMNLSS
jgi:DNA primase